MKPLRNTAAGLANQQRDDLFCPAPATYSSDAVGATLPVKNADYETTFKINLPVPLGSTISNVSWRYGLSNRPVGFEAILCWNDQQRC